MAYWFYASIVGDRCTREEIQNTIEVVWIVVKRWLKLDVCLKLQSYNPLR
jgi:hypothetical protein